MSTRSGRSRPSVRELSPPRTRKGISPPRSPARARKSSPPARSPSRKSPSRKSPSRKPASKFPARKSPSRTTKEATENAAQKSPGKRAPVKTEVSINLQDISTKIDAYRRTRSKRADYSIKDLPPTIDLTDEKIEKLNGIDSLFDSNDIYGLRNRKLVEDVLPRRSTRIREFETLADIRRSTSKSLSKSISKSVSQSIDAYSDEENSEEEHQKRKSESVTRKLATPLRDNVSKLALLKGRWEFGGRIGTVLLLALLPATIFSILLSCKKTCSVQSLLNINAYKNVALWFSVSGISVISSQYILQALLSLLPILGPKADCMDDLGTKSTFNAFFASIFTINILFALNYFNLFDNNILLVENLRLAVVSYIFAVALSIVLYVKSRKLDDSKLNPFGNTGYVLYDFSLGREIHPHIGKLDVKLWIARIANINTLILAVLLFKHGIEIPSAADNVTSENIKEYLSKVQLKPTILVYSLMQIVYILNFITKEYKITSTFFWQSEGLGYLQLVSSALYPFYFTAISKFIVDTNLSLSTNTLISASVLYLAGFVIMLISNNLKHEFRKNPLSPKLTNLESMPTFHGKKLLVSGLWGIVRHPNYTGDIIIHIVLALPGILSNTYIAAAPALLAILVLLHRSWRDHTRCRRRYGAAWDRYCKRVPRVVIPKIL